MLAFTSSNSQPSITREFIPEWLFDSAPLVTLEDVFRDRNHDEPRPLPQPDDPSLAQPRSQSQSQPQPQPRRRPLPEIPIRMPSPAPQSIWDDSDSPSELDMDSDYDCDDESSTADDHSPRQPSTPKDYPYSYSHPYSPYRDIHFARATPSKKLDSPPSLSHLMIDPKLAACLAELDERLLLTPFVAFAEVCYAAAVHDYDPPEYREQDDGVSDVKAEQVKEDVEEDSEDSDETEDEDELASPDQTFELRGWESGLFSQKPILQNLEQELVIRDREPLSPLSFSFSCHRPSGSDDSNHIRYGPTITRDPAAEVAFLFLHTSCSPGAQDLVREFPTRPTPPLERPRGRGAQVKRLFMRRLQLGLTGVR